MKYTLLKTTIVISLIAMQLGCNKPKATEVQPVDQKISPPPQTIPNHLISSSQLLHQYYRLSIGFLKTFTDPAICNNQDLINDLISRIANNGKTPISINSWHNGLQNNNFQFNQPTTSDLYDVVAPQINGNNPPTTIDAWQSDFFGGFLGKYDPVTRIQ